MPETSAAPMQLYANKARLTLSGSRELLSAGMTGVVQVEFSFSADWDGLHKIAVFSNGTQSADVPEEDWQGGICTVPAEVLTLPGKTLMAGIYGTNGTQLVLPTVWCVLGRVEPGVTPAFYATNPPQSPFWAQMRTRLEAVEAAAGTLLVHMTTAAPLTLDRTLSEITAAAQAGRLVMLEISGGVCPLTGLVSGVSAEFTGPVYQSAGAACYRVYTVTSGGAAVEIIPIAAAEADDDAFTVTVSQGSGNSLVTSATCAELFAAHSAGKQLFLVDFTGRLLRPERAEQNNVVFTGVSWSAPDEYFCMISYIFDETGVTQQVVNQDRDYYTRNQINAALGNYITDVAGLVGGNA